MSSKKSTGKRSTGSSGKSTGKSGRSTGKPGKSTRAQERSAGGVVVRDGGEVVVIVPTRRAADGSQVLCLPKGHLDPGETALQAARREVREETGVQAELVQELGEVRYWYRRDGRAVPKSVFFFLFRYLSGDTADHDDEVLEARWMSLSEAQTALSYEGEREMVTRALATLEESGVGLGESGLGRGESEVGTPPVMGVPGAARQDPRAPRRRQDR
jgi:8-oxo-dGTP pyrophosphatase MutT (NUDIX family)